MQYRCNFIGFSKRISICFNIRLCQVQRKAFQLDVVVSISKIREKMATQKRRVSGNCWSRVSHIK